MQSLHGTGNYSGNHSSPVLMICIVPVSPSVNPPLAILVQHLHEYVSFTRPLARINLKFY